MGEARRKVEREFYKLVDLGAASLKVDLPHESIEFIFRYWTLKRRAGGNKPLLPPRVEEVAPIKEVTLTKAQEAERDKMKMLVSIRKDLERVRNLAYMMKRREKFSRSFVELREQILEKQLTLLVDDSASNQLSSSEMRAIIEASHGPTIYDKIYSHPGSEQYTQEDFEVVISRLTGEIKKGSSQNETDLHKDSAGETKKVPLSLREKPSPSPHKKKTQTNSDSIHKNSPVKQKSKDSIGANSIIQETGNSDVVDASKTEKRKSDGLPYVPQRQAAKKASEKLNEQEAWKKKQEALLHSIAVSSSLEENAKPSHGNQDENASKVSSPRSSGSNTDMDSSN